MTNEESGGEEDRGKVRGSPLPGCIILAAIVTVFGGLAVLYTVVGNYQNRVIGGFTQDSPAELAVVTPTPEEADAAVGKLRLIGTAVTEGRAERILFSVTDLNALIATLEAAGGFRGNTVVEGIGEEGIVAAMSQPMRKGIFDKGLRYLNATFVLQPELRARTIAFRVKDIRPATGAVPEEFVKNYAALDFFRLDPGNEFISAHIGSIAAVYCESGHLVVETSIRDRSGTE